ncbi:MAG: TRAP transporter substrate-binding protein [Hyphomicrobiaceae bacterium]
MRLLTLAVAMVAGLQVGAAQADTSLRIGTVVPATSVQGQAVTRFAEIVNAGDAGIRIELFHGGQLGEGSRQAENVRMGIQDGFTDDLTFFMQFSSGLRIANIPFLFEDRAHFESWLQSRAFEEAIDEVVADGRQRLITGNELWWRGPFRVLVATKPILTLQDVSTMRLRLWNSETIMRFWGEGGLGANIANIAWSEVYLGLSQGVIDAVTSPFDLVESMKFGEVAKHIMLFDEYPQVLVLSLNEDKWSGLSDDQRTAVIDAWSEAGRFYNETVEGNVTGWRSGLESQGVTFHEFDRGPFIAKVREINAKLISEGYWSGAQKEFIKSQQ